MKIGYSGKHRVVSEGTAKRYGAIGSPDNETPMFDSKTGLKIGKIAKHETVQSHLCYLYIREQGAKKPILGGSAILVFKLNPQAMTRTLGLKVGVQQGRNGYIVTSAGHAEPRFVIEGNHGWKIMRPPNAQSHLKEIVGAATKLPALDGKENWDRMFELVQKYIDLNTARTILGDPNQPMLELVWADPIHGGNNGQGWRWVVEPAANVALMRTVAQQGSHPYRLELIGIRDDIVLEIPVAKIRPNLTPSAGPRFEVPKDNSPSRTGELPDTARGDVPSDAPSVRTPVATEKPTEPTKPTGESDPKYDFRLEPICVYYMGYFLYKRFAEAGLAGPWASQTYQYRRLAAMRLTRFLVNQSRYDNPEYHKPAYGPASRDDTLIAYANTQPDQSYPTLSQLSAASNKPGMNNAYRMYQKLVVQMWGDISRSKGNGVRDAKPFWLDPQNDNTLPAGNGGR